VEKSEVQILRRAQVRKKISSYLRQEKKMKDEIEISGVRAMTITRLLEEYANSKGEGATLTSKREAWNIAQSLKQKVNQ
jgi:hypothetical protein